MNVFSQIKLYGAKLKNGQHHHEKLKFDVGLTCLVFFFRRNPECCGFLPQILSRLPPLPNDNFLRCAI